MSFAKKYENAIVDAESVNLYWIGQGGFAIKTANGKKILIDPFFTDSVYGKFEEEHGYAFKRLSASLLDADDVIFDEIYISHEHEDHLDVEAFPAACQDAKTQLFCNRESADILKNCGVEPEKIYQVRNGDVIERDGYTVRIVKANHGELCPGAMGFIFDFGFTRIYYSGDTCYDENLIKEIAGFQPEICLLPINGAFGNLNNEEARMFGEGVNGKIMIPYHFWTFPIHLGDPYTLIQNYHKQKDDWKIQLVFLMPGETFVVK